MRQAIGKNSVAFAFHAHAAASRKNLLQRDKDNNVLYYSIQGSIGEHW